MFCENLNFDILIRSNVNGNIKRTHTLADRSRLVPVLWIVSPISEDWETLLENLTV